ncbi:hypothetical protein ACF0H5_012471 [Mactra antiquata]
MLPNQVRSEKVDEQVKDANIVLRQRRAATALVDVTKFTYDVTGGKFQVYADDTMSRMIVTVTVYKSRPIIMATMPTDYGNWNFQKLDGASWEVKIQAESPVSIKQELFELGTSTPISGHPTVGVTIKEYSTFTISFIVTNLLNTAQDTDIRIDDGGRGFVQPPKFLGPTLKVGENYTGNFTLKVSFAGLPLSVKITAREYVAGGPKPQTPSIVEKRNFTVVSSTTSASTTPTKTRSTTASNTSQSSSSTSKTQAVGQPTVNPGGHVTGTTITVPSNNVPGGNKSQQNMQSSTLSNPHSGGQTFDHSEESKGAANDDEGSRMGVPATVALSVSGFISGTLVGIGVVAGAIAIHKKMKNKKVSADDSKDSSMNGSNKTFTKERTSSKSMAWH